MGGIARVTIAKANALAAIPGNEVWIAYTDVDPRHPEPLLALDPKVKTIDLGIRYYKDDRRGLLFRLRGNSVLRRKHKLALEQALAPICPDVVISIGQCEKYFLPTLKLPHRPLYVREFHYNKNYRLDSARSPLKRLIARINNFYDYRLRLPRYDIVGLLTKEDADMNWRRSPVTSRIRVVPNPLTEEAPVQASPDSRLVVTVGRISYQKNHESLLRAWAKVARRYPDWKLAIYGSGELSSQLQRQITDMGLQDSVSAPGSVSDPLRRMAEGSIFALTSRFEGFALVIIEAAAVGLPIVSYTCPCGPREAINDGTDGLLVPFGNEDAFADALLRLIENPDLRAEMGNNAKLMALRYSPENIAARWMQIFSECSPTR